MSDNINYKKTKHDTDVEEKTPDKSKITRHLRWSRFHQVINTNKRFGRHDEDLEKFKHKLEKTIDDMVDIKNIHKFVKLTKKGDNGDGLPFTRQFVKDYFVDFAIERSRKNDTVHAHIYFEFSHYACIHLDLDAIRDFVCKEMGLSSVYVPRPRVIMGNVQRDNVMKYLLKDTIDEKADLKEVDTK